MRLRRQVISKGSPSYPCFVGELNISDGFDPISGWIRQMAILRETIDSTVNLDDF